jgi:hypothetical protein
MSVPTPRLVSARVGGSLQENESFVFVNEPESTDKKYTAFFVALNHFQKRLPQPVKQSQPRSVINFQSVTKKDIQNKFT